ncbi:helix-turn-helix domain-containing protein [Actinoplanes sp. NPDC048988]|uniref:helix-turn-helix domain-containing protein n=1 Tax=Actinoplanes sp. NPDC048988 TaxID=3363901 RepID=UPI00371EFB6E
MSHSTEATPQHPLAAVRELIRDTRDLSANERMVLVVIATHSNRDGDAYPSAQTIADIVGCSLRTVQRAVARLVNLGRLAVRRVAGIASNVYRVLTSAPQPTMTSGNEAASKSSAVASAPVTPEVPKFSEGSKGAPRRDWRRFLPSGVKSNNPASGTQPFQRRGAALPPAVGADRCSRHVGQLAAHCAPCRSEAIGGVA